MCQAKLGRGGVPTPVCVFQFVLGREEVNGQQVSEVMWHLRLIINTLAGRLRDWLANIWMAMLTPCNVQ